MPGKLKINRLIASVLPLLLIGGCVTIYNPATERKETLLIDTRQEVALGKDMDMQIQNKMKIIKSLFMQERLNRIGSRVADFSDRQDLFYHFRVIDDKELNAFAIPGGFIYVNSGLMQAATDDELACVLAHEIGHIAARHSVKKLQSVMGYQLVISLALGLSGRQEMSQALDIVFNLVNLGYSRKDELLADKLSVRYAGRARFDPYAAITFFEKLKKEASSKGPQNKLVFLSSHPSVDERIENIKKEISLSSSLP